VQKGRGRCESTVIRLTDGKKKGLRKEVGSLTPYRRTRRSRAKQKDRRVVKGVKITRGGRKTHPVRYIRRGGGRMQDRHSGWEGIDKKWLKKIKKKKKKKRKKL